PLKDRLEEARAVATEFDPEPPIDGADAAPAGDQREMVHRLPKAPCVDRIAHLAAAAEGRSVVHVGFVDSGYREMQEDAGTWLHAHLATTARGLVGLDLDSEGVELARQAGFDAHAIDCRDHAAVRAAGIEPAELVIAGEV